MADAPISQLLAERTCPILSYEFFPPQDEQGIERLKENAERLLASRPDFVTVTWGAGGSARSRTLDLCESLRDLGFAPVMPHLTCVGVSRGELNEIADEIYDRGFRNIMALRGDPPRGEKTFVPHADGLAHADELVALLKARHEDLCVGVAGYPETHPESTGVGDDVAHLKLKVQAGADFITSQLFFDNRFFFDFEKLCRSVGIQVPIIAGLLPAMSLKQAQRFMTMCGASFPPQLALDMRHAGDRGPGAEEVGIEWTARQVEELLQHDVPGVHLYVLNRSKAAMAPAVKACFDRVRSA